MSESFTEAFSLTPEERSRTRRSLKLESAARYGQVAALDELLKEGADIRKLENPGEETALHLAVAGGHTAFVKRLLTLGVTINAQDESGDTALHIAVRSNHQACVALLRSAGADTELENLAGEKALECGADASKQPTSEASQKKKKKKKKKKAEDNASQALPEEAKEDAPEEQKSRKPAATPQQIAALHQAARAGKTDDIEQFLAQGVSIDASDEHGNTALHIAVMHENLNSVEYLLLADANTGLVNQAGKKAIECGDPDGDVVLYMKGVEEGLRQAAGKLEQKGASAEDAEDSTSPESLAMRLYSYAERPYDDSLHEQEIRKNAENVEECLMLILVLGVKIEDLEKWYMERFGDTPLHQAAQNSHPEIVKILLRSGMNVNLKSDLDHREPLVYAHRSQGFHTLGSVCTVGVLLEHGATISDKKYLQQIVESYKAAEKTQADIIEAELLDGEKEMKKSAPLPSKPGERFASASQADADASRLSALQEGEQPAHAARKKKKKKKAAHGSFKANEPPEAKDEVPQAPKARASGDEKLKFASNMNMHGSFSPPKEKVYNPEVGVSFKFNFNYVPAGHPILRFDCFGDFEAINGYLKTLFGKDTLSLEDPPAPEKYVCLIISEKALIIDAIEKILTSEHSFIDKGLEPDRELFNKLIDFAEQLRQTEPGLRKLEIPKLTAIDLEAGLPDVDVDAVPGPDKGRCSIS